MEARSENENRTPILNRKIRALTTTIALLGMVGLAGYGFYFVISQTIWPGRPEDNWMLAVLQTHYAATLGVPMSAAAALCIVLLLETVAGPIEIEIPWVKFRGAAAPVILWIFCFLAMTFALGHLWGDDRRIEARRGNDEPVARNVRNDVASKP